MTPRKGFRFYHARVLDLEKMPAKEPQLYEVTKIARGCVYYRPVYDSGTRQSLGSPDCCPSEQFSRYCLRPAS